MKPRSYLFFVFLSLFLLSGYGGISDSNSPKSPPTPVFQLAEDYYEELLKLNPVLATYNGDYRYNERLAIDIGEEYRKQERELCEKYLTKLKAIDQSKAKDEDQATLLILKRELEFTLEGQRFPQHLIPISQMFSFPAAFAQLGSGSGAQPFKTVKDYDNFLMRVGRFVHWIDAVIVNMKEGVRTGIVQPRTIIEASLPQWEELSSSDTSQSIFYQPVKGMPQAFHPSDRERLARAYTRAIGEQIAPAYKRLHAYLRDEYLPRCRATISLKELPGGEAWYSYLVKYYTTTDLKPEVIFEIGSSEVEQIKIEMQKTVADIGFDGTVPQFLQGLRNNPKARIYDKDSVFIEYNRIRRIVEGNLPKLFRTIPKTNFEIRPTEEFRAPTAAGGDYFAGTADGSRPGVFYANTYRMPYPKQSMEDLFLHEALPGHHFDRSIALEQMSIPRFRRYTYYGAYGEGWALYAESLGKDLGLYTDPYQYFGMLMAQMLRSARLVGDVGIHYKGWTKEQATQYLQQNTYYFGVSEIDRYTAMPGQALAYKVGQLRILQLRQKAEKELGSNFDVRDFHEQILKDGAMPIAVLEAKIGRWIGSKK